MQEKLLKEVEERMSTTLHAMEPEAMLKTWLPATLKGYEQLQEMRQLSCHSSENRQLPLQPGP
jgi:hypothetical protein